MREFREYRVLRNLRALNRILQEENIELSGLRRVLQPIEKEAMEIFTKKTPLEKRRDLAKCIEGLYFGGMGSMLENTSERNLQALRVSLHALLKSYQSRLGLEYYSRPQRRFPVGSVVRYVNGPTGQTKHKWKVVKHIVEDVTNMPQYELRLITKTGRPDSHAPVVRHDQLMLVEDRSE